MSTAIIISALAMGALSSFHCVGMCGAIAFSLPTQHLAGWKKVTGIFLYNLGRITTYTLLGVLFGIAGRGIYVGGFQQWFSIVAGLFILAVLAQSFFKKPFLHLPGYEQLNYFVQNLIGKFISKPSFGNIFLLGSANGLLPCGLVYLALTGALASGTISGASTFMAAFGAGTFPALFLLSYFGFLINLSVRNRIKKAVPYFVAMVGVLLILRGMGLDIPYVSPLIAGAHEDAVKCH